jgi:LuxR family maltose regulon positive regulatory protein
LHLDGQAATVHELLAGFPVGMPAADAGLAVVAAADELAHESLEAAERYLALAERHSGSMPAGRGEYERLLFAVVRLLVDRQRGNLSAVATDVRELQAMTEVADASRPGFGADLRALALISLGGTEFWADAYDDAARHLEQGVALARRIGRPYLEFTGLAQWSAVAIVESFTRAVELGTEAAELAERHGWTGDPAFGLVGASLGAVLTWQWRAEEAERWLQTAERILGADQPGMAAAMRFVRGELELLRNRDAVAVAAFQAADLLAGQLASPHMLIPWIRALLLLAMVRLGQTGSAGQFLAGLSGTDRERGEIRMAEAALRLAEDDPRAATAALAPVLDGSAPVVMENGRALAYVLEAVARDRLGDSDAADRALERALDLAEPDGLVLPFLLVPAKGLLERRAGHRTAHAALVAEIRGMLAGHGGHGRQWKTSSEYGGGSPHGGDSLPPAGGEGPGGIVPPMLLEPLSESEVRVLRYLPTNLTTPEIARELSVSPNTVRTHIRHMYAKLGAHHRAETVELARARGLLAPSRTGRATARPE